MLQRIISPKGVVYYRSPLLQQTGAAHAFSTRLGGVSPAPFDSLNLGNPSGCARQDSNEQIQANYARLQEALGLADAARCWVHQVHGAEVLSVQAGEDFANGRPADALVSNDPNRVIAVRVADCVPILLASDDGKKVAAIHAGWRGVIAGVVGRAVEAMGHLPTKICAAIGPCIGLEAFAVGEEVLCEFERAFGRDAPLRRSANGKGWVDLRAAVQAQLIGTGVSKAQIDASDRCTYRDREEFFSHRREQGLTGRMAALIAPV